MADDDQNYGYEDGELDDLGSPTDDAAAVTPPAAPSPSAITDQQREALKLLEASGLDPREAVARAQRDYQNEQAAIARRGQPVAPAKPAPPRALTTQDLEGMRQQNIAEARDAARFAAQSEQLGAAVDEVVLRTKGFEDSTADELESIRHRVGDKLAQDPRARAKMVNGVVQPVPLSTLRALITEATTGYMAEERKRMARRLGVAEVDAGAVGGVHKAAHEQAAERTAGPVAGNRPTELPYGKLNVHWPSEDEVNEELVAETDKFRRNPKQYKVG